MSDCLKCLLSSAEHKYERYTVTGDMGSFTYDVDKARSIIAGGGVEFVSPVPPEGMAALLKVNSEIEVAHLDHVDSRHPGILAFRLGSVVLIDGTHRMHRAHRDGLPFSCYLLSPEQSVSCLMESSTKHVEAEEIAKELRNMLQLTDGLVEVSLHLDGGDTPESGERDIRAFFNAEENARLVLGFF